MDNYLHTQKGRNTTPDTDNAEDGIRRMWPLLLTAAFVLDLLTLLLYLVQATNHRNARNAFEHELIGKTILIFKYYNIDRTESRRSILNRTLALIATNELQRHNAR